jgi:hypothetical protein
MEDNTRYRWTAEELAGKDIPDSAKAFLSTTGLPCWLRGSTIEFGSFDSPDSFVIGQDYENAIYLTPDGKVWCDSGARSKNDYFLNSSVEQLAHFLEVLAHWTDGLEDSSDEELENASIRTFDLLKEHDPSAFAVQLSFWQEILDSAQ